MTPDRSIELREWTRQASNLQSDQHGNGPARTGPWVYPAGGDPTSAPTGRLPLILLAV